MERKERKDDETIPFLTIPKILFLNERFRELSNSAKLLYGIFLDRNSLSKLNGWKDGDNRIYIYYTIKNIAQILGCSEKKAMKTLNELENVNLIEREKQGLGKPSKILVKRMKEEEKNGCD